jgi:hypothetical protein
MPAAGPLATYAILGIREKGQLRGVLSLLHLHVISGIQGTAFKGRLPL